MDIKKLVASVPGSTTESEIEWLYKITKKLSRDGVVVEMGSFLGKSTITLAIASRVKVYAVDPHLGEAVINHQFSGPTYGRFLKNLRKAGVYKRVVPIRKTSRQAFERWSQPISLLFVDGDHSYEGVSWDLEHFGKWVTNEGIVVLHDAINPGDGPPRASVKYLLTKPQYKNFGIKGSMLYCQKGTPRTVRQWWNWMGFFIAMRVVAGLIMGSIFIQQIVVKRWMKQWLNQ